MRISIKAEIASRRASGNFFTKDPTKTMMGNALDAIEWLAAEGTKAIAGGIPSDANFDRGNLEGMSYKRDQMLTGRQVQSRFGKSHVRGAQRGTRPLRGTLTSEVDGMTPYVQMAVIERDKKMVKRAYSRMKAYERSIRADITKGLT